MLPPNPTVKPAPTGASDLDEDEGFEYPIESPSSSAIGWLEEIDETYMKPTFRMDSGRAAGGATYFRVSNAEPNEESEGLEAFELPLEHQA